MFEQTSGIRDRYHGSASLRAQRGVSGSEAFGIWRFLAAFGMTVSVNSPSRLPAIVRHLRYRLLEGLIRYHEAEGMERDIFFEEWTGGVGRLGEEVESIGAGVDGGAGEEAAGVEG